MIEDELTKGGNKEAKQTFKKGEMLNWKSNTSFLSLSKKTDSKNGNCSGKRGFFEMTGKYVNGQDKERAEQG